MAGKNTAVFGVYGSHAEAERAVSALQSAGFRSTDISVLFPENEGTKDFAHEKGTKAPEGAATGAGTGAALGGALGWLTGIGALAIPGLGPFIAAGPIMAALAGAGVGGTLGGITGALVGMGIPEYEAKRYEGRVKKGGILLSVHSDGGDWTDSSEEDSRVDRRPGHRVRLREKGRLRKYGQADAALRQYIRRDAPRGNPRDRA